LAVVTEESLALKKEITRYAKDRSYAKDLSSFEDLHRKMRTKGSEDREEEDIERGEPAFIKSLEFQVDRTVQAIEDANTSSAALGRTLDLDYHVVLPEPNTRFKSE
jgi:hypothetical protein